MMPVTKKDIVKARVTVIVILELLHIVIAMIFSIFTFRLYPEMYYYFFAPHLGFWGLCLFMFALDLDPHVLQDGLQIWSSNNRIDYGSYALRW